MRWGGWIGEKVKTDTGKSLFAFKIKEIHHFFKSERQQEWGRREGGAGEKKNARARK